MDSRIRIVIIDHCPVFRDGLSLILGAERDFEVIGRFESEKAAIEQVEEFLPDVAIIDCDMTQIDGLGAATKIRESSPKTAILMVSSYDWELHVLASVRLGAAGYFLRDAPIVEITSAVRAVHSGQLVFHSKVATHIRRSIDRMYRLERGAKSGVEVLNYREIQVIRLVAQGMNNRNIAAALFISEHTVQAHLINIFKKLRVNSRTEAAIHVLKEGLLDTNQITRAEACHFQDR